MPSTDISIAFSHSLFIDAPYEKNKKKNKIVTK
jgi:hypothetical protein